jgi:hypothetical protein
MNNLTLLIALIAVIAGFVLAIRNGEYRNGTFWLVTSIVLLLVVPLLPALHA